MAKNPEFGKKIRELREAKKKGNPKFSLRQFAQEVGISATFLSKIENGEFDPPSPDNIIKIAGLLEVDPDELLELAKKVDPEVEDIVRSRHKVMADFLRTAQSLSDDDLKKITNDIRKDVK